MSQQYNGDPSFDGSYPPNGSFRSERYRDLASERGRLDGGALDSLRHAGEHAFGAESDTLGDTGRRAKDATYAASGFVATHAIPLALLGAGLGALMVSVNRQRAGGQPIGLPRFAGVRGAVQSRGRMGSVPGQHQADIRSRLVEGAHELSDQASTRVGAVAGRAGHAIEDVRSQAQQLGHDARERLQGGLSDLNTHAHDLTHQALELGHDLRDQAVQLGQQGYDQLAQLGQQGYQQLRRAQQRSEELVHDNPLVVGALAVAAGVGVGMLLPATRHENQLLGKTRDRLLHEAKTAASRLAETTQHAAHDLKSALLDDQAPQA